ncbi:MAG TPA: PQQ-binding-like beta-propeller repeat protein [Vicinamibacterales bacterium]|nr:PQQ-binding-like beta-propeller repeat protein [Vicinamibacterales bacterium]
MRGLSAGAIVLAATVAGASLVYRTVTLIAGGAAHTTQSASDSWSQWGGPQRNFVSASTVLADEWPESGPPVIWSRPLGTGHSAIVTDGDGLLFTMYRTGNGRGRQGPWEAGETVVALEAASGKTAWEHSYPSGIEDFSFGAGPHATPLVVGDRLFTIGTNQQLFAFDRRTGRVLWSRDFIREFGSPELLIRPVVKVGYGCSPIAWRDTIICSVGGPGQSVMAFRQSDGAVVWKGGDFLTSAAAPILIDVDGQIQAVFLAGGAIAGLDPDTGRVLWSHVHDPGNDLNCGTPLWGPDNILFVSSAYKAGSRAIRLRQSGGVTEVEELWFTNRVRYMFLSAVRVGDYVYGTTGDFGPAFLTALDVRTGESAWQHRGFSRASLLYAGDKAILMDEDGDLALVRLAPDGLTVLSEAKVFDTVSWTAPTLVGTTLYARDREKIVAFDVGRRESRRTETPSESGSGAVTAVADMRGGTAPAPLQSGTIDAPVDLSGTWKLDAADADAAATGPSVAGLSAAGAPPMLFITHAANGTVLVESSINGSQARTYRPGRTISSPALQGGTATTTAAWAGRTLTAEGTIAPTSGKPTPIGEVYAISDDRATLTVDVTGEVSGRLRYVRITNMGPCQTWPTPCKR